MNSDIWKSILRGISWAVGGPILSFVFIHLFAIFGIFIFGSYPIWWLAFPKFTDNAYNLITSRIRDQEYVPKARPRRIAVLFVDMLFIFLVAVLSIAIVYGEYLLIGKFHPGLNEETVSFVIPDHRQYRIGEIFPVDLDIKNPGSAINVVQADIYFDSNLATLTEVAVDQSFAKVFVQKEISNEKGYMRLTGGLPNPGYTGESGHFAKIYFKAKSAGLFQISLLPTSLVLENDGLGTNILKEYPSFTYVIRHDELSQMEQELQDEIFKEQVLGVTVTQDPEYLVFFEPSEVNLDMKDVSEDVIPKQSNSKGFIERVYDFDKTLLRFLRLNNQVL